LIDVIDVFAFEQLILVPLLQPHVPVLAFMFDSQALVLALVTYKTVASVRVRVSETYLMVCCQSAVPRDECCYWRERGGCSEQLAEPCHAARRRDNRCHKQVQHLCCQRQHNKVDEVRRRRG